MEYCGPVGLESFKWAAVIKTHSSGGAVDERGQNQVEVILLGFRVCCVLGFTSNATYKHQLMFSGGLFWSMKQLTPKSYSKNKEQLKPLHNMLLFFLSSLMMWLSNLLPLPHTYPLITLRFFSAFYLSKSCSLHKPQILAVPAHLCLFHCL